jgi:hypothetical protein
MKSTQIEFKTKFRKFGLILLIIATIFFFLPNKTYATSGSIYTIQNNAGQLPWYPPVGSNGRQVARDSAGNLYAVYQNEGAGSNLNIFLAKSTDEGQTWTPQAVTTDANYMQQIPSIAIDSHDNLHVVWDGATADSLVNHQIRYREYTNGVWQPIVELTTDANNYQYGTALAIDSQDNLHVVWGGGTADSLGNINIRYREYTNGVWQPIVELTTDAVNYQETPSIAIDSSDNIHVVWDGNTDDFPVLNQIRYREYTNGSWQPIVELTTAAVYKQYFPSIAIDSHDNLHVVWEIHHGNNQIAYREYTNGSWQLIYQFTPDGGPLQAAPSIAIDSHDNLHVVWIGYVVGLDNQQIRYDEYTDGSWQTVANLTFSENIQINPNIIWAEWPKICGAQTNVPKDGFFAIWSESIGPVGSGTAFNAKDFVSSDLAWQSQSCPAPTPPPAPTPTLTNNNDLTILPQTGANLLPGQLQSIFGPFFF